MDIYEMLRLDHVSIRDFLEQLIENTSLRQNREEWPDIFQRFKIELVSHNRAEEATFYSRLQDHPNTRHLVPEREEEHRLAEELIHDLELRDPMDRDWATKLAVIKDTIIFHIEEEESEIFAQARSVLSDQEARHLAIEYDHLRSDIVEGAGYFPKGRSLFNPAGLDLEGNRPIS